MAYILSLQAEAELDDIWVYIASNSGSLDIADRLADSFIDHFHLLAKNPRIGRLRDYDLSAGVRSFPAGKYVILYRIHGDDLQILHVIRGSRDIPPLLR